MAMIPCLVRERNTLALLDLGNSRTTSFTNEFVWRVRGKPQRILWFILNFPVKMIMFGVCQIFRHKSAFALLLISRTKCLSFSMFLWILFTSAAQVSYFLNRPQRFHHQGGKHNVPSPQMTGSHAWKTHVRMGIYNMLLGEFTNKWKRGAPKQSCKTQEWSPNANHTLASQFQSMSPNYAKWSISISKAQNWQAGIFLCEAS